MRPFQRGLFLRFGTTSGGADPRGYLGGAAGGRTAERSLDARFGGARGVADLGSRGIVPTRVVHPWGRIALLRFPHRHDDAFHQTLIARSLVCTRGAGTIPAKTNNGVRATSAKSFSWPEKPSVCVVWWSRSGSNRRPRHCERRALPTELRPLRRVKWRIQCAMSSQSRGAETSMVCPFCRPAHSWQR